MRSFCVPLGGDVGEFVVVFELSACASSRHFAALVFQQKRLRSIICAVDTVGCDKGVSATSGSLFGGFLEAGFQFWGISGCPLCVREVPIQGMPSAGVIVVDSDVDCVGFNNVEFFILLGQKQRSR